jgi:GNAT superfamily N-acetyltransferase
VRDSSTSLGMTKKAHATTKRDDFRIAVARAPAQIARCFDVMRELRPHFSNCKKFVEQVQRQQREGYFLAFVEHEDEVRAVAGYRFIEWLFSGRFLYVDDLVTRASDRSLGYGARLMDWLIARAREEKCGSIELDSGVQRFDAHRFYFAQRMKISSYHFSLKLEGVSGRRRRFQKLGVLPKRPTISV